MPASLRKTAPLLTASVMLIKTILSHASSIAAHANDSATGYSYFSPAIKRRMDQEGGKKYTYAESRQAHRPLPLRPLLRASFRISTLVDNRSQGNVEAWLVRIGRKLGMFFPGQRQIARPRRVTNLSFRFSISKIFITQRSAVAPCRSQRGDPRPLPPGLFEAKRAPTARLRGESGEYP